jgi:hypothetical protein
MAAQTFIRGSRLGDWECLLATAQARGVERGMAFLDGTSIRAHQKAAGAAKKVPLGRNEVLVKRLAPRWRLCHPSLRDRRQRRAGCRV